LMPSHRTTPEQESMDTFKTPDPKALATLVSNVTQTMMGMSFAAKDFSDASEKRRFDASWRTAMLPIPGQRPVTIALSSDQKSSAALCAAMFSVGENAIDESMMDDALSELVNMTAGQIKGALGLDQALGLPKIVKDPELTRIGEVPWRCVALQAGRVELVVWLAEHVFPR
jgi:hypothetical protein